MKATKLITSFFLATSLSLFANDTYSKQRLESFFDDFSCEQKDELSDAGLSDPCSDQSSNVNPPPPPSGKPIPPAPMSGMLPIVISNTTGLPDNEVYVTAVGKQTATGATNFFFQLDTTTGLYTPVVASNTTYSPTFSVLLSDFKKSTTGPHDYIAYIPEMVGGRFYFSIRRPMYLESDDPVPPSAVNNLAAPQYYAFYDPNYNNLFETIEVTFFPNGGGGGTTIPWTASVNTTEVDAFCFPIRIGYFSFDASSPNTVTPLVQDPNALPSGFGTGGLAGFTTRNQIINELVSKLGSKDQTGLANKVWPRLAIPFYTDPYNKTGLQTHIRVLSPKQSLGNASSPATIGNITAPHLPNVDGSGTTTFHNYNYPPFPTDYFSATTYGNTNGFANDLFSAYTGGTMLYLSTGGGSPTVYQGVTTGSAGSYTLTFTGISGPNTGSSNTLLQSNLNVFEMFSGSQAMTGPGPDGTNLGFFFGDAFTVGVLPSSIGTSMLTPIDITDATVGGWEDTTITNGDYYRPSNATAPFNLTGGPWYDLYAGELHNMAVRNPSTTFLNNYGLCYGYDFDDSLGISGTITPSILTPDTDNPYLIVTLGTIEQSTIPDPYSDNNTYSVTFNFPTTSPTINVLEIQQGNGPKTPVTSGVPVTGLKSNSSTPLRIFYSGQNMLKETEFILYLYNQFMVPQNKYTSVETSVINAASITPNSSTPTAFTIPLPDLNN